MDFKVYTNALKAYEAPSGDLYVTGTTSSTIRDLHGDEMTLNAIRTMADTAKQNMTIFLNHNYNVPEDLFGSVTDARVVKRFDAESNQEVYDLDIDVLVCKEDENPEAMRAFKAIKRGVKLGLSIGARVDRVSKKKDVKTGEDTYVIDSVKLMEASVVGIPANQRSYLQNAIKSLKAAEKAGEIEIGKVAATDIAEGDFVSWDSSGGTARGRVEHVMREGTLGVPDSDFKIEATPDDPAVLIRIWRDGADGWAETDKLVGHKASTLRKIESLKSFDDLAIKAVEMEGQPAPERAALINALQDLLADTVAFYLKAHSAHWNVVGEDFTEYHILFEEIYRDVRKAIDPTAELLRKLNAPTLAGINEIAARANGEPVADDNDPESLAESVYAANETVLDCILRAINEAAKLNQQGVLNFLGERQDKHQGWSWQLRASLAPEEAEPEPAETPEVPGDMPETEVEDAFKAASNWSCCGSKSLPVAETDRAWDGAAAKARIFSWAGFDGNNPSPEKASRAFLIHDTANSDLKGAYKLPFADVVDGELKAIPSGIRAAAGRLPNTDAPADVLKSARGVIDAYERKMNPEKSAESVLAEGDLTVDTEKATRVTVTVTQSDDKETKKPAEENQAPEAAGMEAEAAVAKSDNEPVAEPVVETPAEEPAAEEAAAEEPAAEEAVDPAVQVLQDLGAVLVRASADERARIISKVAALTGDGEPEAVEPEVAEEAVVAAEEPKAEVAVEAEAVEAPAVDEVTAIAKSALDAAFAAQQEVAAVKAQLTELLRQKATVEADLAKALDVVGRLMDLPSGRKAYSVAQSNTGTKAPWLSPVIQRMLDSEE